MQVTPTTFHAGVLAFNRPAEEGEFDMVGHVAYLLEAYVGEFAKNCFLSDPSIISVQPLKANAQRVIINKYFIGLLLQFRSLEPIKVSAVATLFSNDGTIEDWISIAKTNTFPFFKDNKIFETIYNGVQEWVKIL